MILGFWNWNYQETKQKLTKEAIQKSCLLSHYEDLKQFKKKNFSKKLLEVFVENFQ